MKNTLIILALVILSMEFSSSCKKIDPDSGDNQNIDTSTALPNTFMNNKVGSWWHYGSSGDPDAHSFKRYATEIDTIKEGLPLQLYDRFDLVDSANIPEYFGTFDSALVTLFDLDGSQTDYVPFIFYIRGSEVGDSWENTGSANYSGTNINLKIVTELEAEDQVLSWYGKTFNNVYRVRSELYGGPLSTHVGTVLTWFNDGVGIVKTVADINILSFYNRSYRDSLIDYHFVP